MEEESASLFWNGGIERNADVKAARSAQSRVKSVRMIAKMPSVMTGSSCVCSLPHSRGGDKDTSFLRCSSVSVIYLGFGLAYLT